MRTMSTVQDLPGDKISVSSAWLSWQNENEVCLRSASGYVAEAFIYIKREKAALARSPSWWVDRIHQLSQMGWELGDGRTL